MTGRSWEVGVVLTLGLLLSSGASAAVVVISGASFSTAGPVVLAGSVETNVSGGLLAEWDSGENVQLEAERVEVEVEWERGRSIPAPDGSRTRIVDDSGEETFTLDARNLTLDAWQDSAQAVVIPTEGVPTIQASGVGRTDVTAVQDITLAKAGYSDQAQGETDGTLPGYEYTVNSPSVVQTHLDEGAAHGNYSLFVNNVTISASSPGDDFSTWSGLRTQPTAPGVQEYHLRVVVLRLESANLTAETPDRLATFSTSTETRWEGTVEAQEPDGEVRYHESQIDLTDDHLTLSGAGMLQAQPDAQPYRAEPLQLNAEIAGSLDLLSGVRPEATLPEAAPGLSTNLGMGLWLFLGTLGGVLLIGFSVLRNHPALLRPLPSPVKDWLYQRWQSTGSRHFWDAEYEAAEVWHRRAAYLFPRRPRPWVDRALALLEAEAPRQSLQAIREAQASLESLAPLDLYEIEVAAAVSSGDDEVARAALLELAQESPQMASGLIEDLSLDELGRDAEIQSALEPDEPIGGLPAYA